MSLSASFYENNDGCCGLVLSLSPFNARVTREMDINARQLKDAAKTLSGLSDFAPFVFRDVDGSQQKEADNWWLECFGNTEQELEERQTILAKRFHKTKIWKRKERKAILSEYIKVSQMLTVGHGLTTIWR